MNKHLLQSFPRSTQDRLTGQIRAGHRPKQMIVIELSGVNVARVWLPQGPHQQEGGWQHGRFYVGRFTESVWR